MCADPAQFAAKRRKRPLTFYASTNEAFVDIGQLRAFINRAWNVDVMPTLVEYVAIPCESQTFDPEWEAHGHMNRAAILLADWARAHLNGCGDVRVEVLSSPGRTPLLFIDVPGRAEGAVLIYGHLDKQPPMSGWAPGRDAWKPTLEGDRLFGRGGADDGYAMFSAVTAVQALHAQGLRHPRCMIVIEASEESGSPDLRHYIEQLAPSVGVPDVVIALDANCGTYEQLWLTTSLRGQVAGTLSVRVLREGMHSGEASGVVPSSFRIARHLLSRLENAATGEIFPSDFHVPIPMERRSQAEEAAKALGPTLKELLPLSHGTNTVVDDPVELLLNRTWRPQACIIGQEGLPEIRNAAAVMHPSTALKISLRLPPTLDAERAAQALKSLLETEPPYGCEVTFHVDLISQGWHAPPLSAWLAASVERASQRVFGRPSALIGGGGGIPFLAMLTERYPQTQFLVTGVLGPQSNAHGPNEFLHVPTAIRLTSAIALLLHDAMAGPDVSRQSKAFSKSTSGLDGTIQALNSAPLCESRP
jgi:acetylornithine deacetylase/succinyl-diaminopimelate desuccinylase-like protein